MSGSYCRKCPKKNKWITASILEIGKTRDYLYKLARQSGQLEDWVLAKLLRNSVNEACKAAKNDYVKGLLFETAGEPKKFWEHLKPLIKEDNCNEVQEIELEKSEKSEVTNTFNEYFTSIGINLKDKIVPLTQGELSELTKESREVGLSNHQPNRPIKLKFRKTVSLEVEQLVKRINVNKSSGIPKINTYLLKLCFKHTLTQLVHLLNQSIVGPVQSLKCMLEWI